MLIEMSISASVGSNMETTAKLNKSDCAATSGGQAINFVSQTRRKSEGA
jgi:hypothetical protein